MSEETQSAWKARFFDPCALRELLARRNSSNLLPKVQIALAAVEIDLSATQAIVLPDWTVIDLPRVTTANRKQLATMQWTVVRR